MGLTKMEWSELVLIALGLVAVFAVSGKMILSLSLGRVVGYSAALLLSQGLLRDIVRVVAARAQREGGKRKIACLCAESSVGLLLVAMAIGLSLIGISEPVSLGRMGMTGIPAIVLLGGFMAKDYVLIIRREKDHASVIVW